MAIPTVQTAQTPVSGIGAVTPTWPAHVAGDIALLFVESCGGEAISLSTPAGFVQITNSPQSTGALTTGTRLAVYWCRATSGAMANPTVADPGNHVYAQIITFRGCATSGDPWNITGGGVKATASTSVSVPGVTTTVDDCLVVVAVARDNDNASAAFSAWSNASLSSLAEITGADVGTTQGNGGGIGVAAGGKAVAGATGTTTATVTSSINAFMTIALKPAIISPSASLSPSSSVSASLSPSASVSPSISPSASLSPSSSASPSAQASSIYPTISIVLIHDKADNAAQVTNVLDLLTTDVDGNYFLNTGDTYPAKIHHIVPSGAEVSNITSLRGTATWYASNQNTNRHFNRGFIRGDNHSEKLIVVVRDSSGLTVTDIVNANASMTGTTRMITTSDAYYMQIGIVKEVGVIPEDVSMDSAISAYQTTLENRGYSCG